MRILIDESLPHYLTSIFKDHSAETVQEKGLSGISNGDLLAFAENKYDIFLSSDKNLKQFYPSPNLLQIAYSNYRHSKSIKYQLTDESFAQHSQDYGALSPTRGFVCLLFPVNGDPR